MKKINRIVRGNVCVEVFAGKYPVLRILRITVIAKCAEKPMVRRLARIILLPKRLRLDRGIIDCEGLCLISGTNQTILQHLWLSGTWQR